MNSLPSWAGTIPGWVTAIVSTGGFAAWLKYLIDRRKVEGDRVGDLERENRQLRLDFDAYRDKCMAESERHYELIKGLRSQMQHLELRELERMRGEIPSAAPATFRAHDK